MQGFGLSMVSGSLHVLNAPRFEGLAEALNPTAPPENIPDFGEHLLEQQPTGLFECYEP
jgi:hypothetical protein